MTWCANAGLEDLESPAQSPDLNLTFNWNADWTNFNHHSPKSIDL